MSRVRLPDGRTVQFPDGLSDEDIEARVRELIDQPAPQPTAPAPDPQIATRGGHVGGRPPADILGVTAEGAARSLMLGTQDVGRGLADIPGMLVDIPNMIANLAPLAAESGINLFLDDEDEISLPRFRTDAGAQLAENVGRIAEAAGVPLVDRSTLSTQEKVISNVNRLATGAIATGGAVAPIASTSRVAQSLASPGLGGLAVDTTAGAGAGLGLAGAEILAPESPIAALFSALAGGLFGAKTAQTAVAPRAAAQTVKSFLPDPDVPPVGDPNLGQRVSRRTADKAATELQGAATDPTQAAARIGERVDAAALGSEPLAPSGVASDDIGLILRERAARGKDPQAFQEQDQIVRDAADERVKGLRDPEARPDAARELVEADVATQRATVAEPVVQARSELDTLRTENTRLTAELETERAGKLASRDTAIAEQKIAKDDAIQSERDLGGEVAGRGDKKVAASEDIAEQVAATKKTAETKKAGLFEEASEAGQGVKVGPEELAADAAAIRDEIGPLAAQDSSLQNIMRDLERLAEKRLEDTGNVDASGNPILQEVEQTVTAADLIEMTPRLSAARKAARRLFRGDVVNRLDRITKNIKGIILREKGVAEPFQKAETNFKEDFAPKFREGVGKTLDKAERAGSPVPATTQGAKFLKPGAGGKEAAQDFKRILGSEGDAAARQFVLADMASVVSGGVINPARLRTWIQNREGLFQAQPALRTEANKVLQDVMNRRGATTTLQRDLERAGAARKVEAAKLQKNIDEVKAKGKLSEKQKQEQIAGLERDAAQVERDIRQNGTRLLLDADPQVAAGKVFSNDDPVTKMGEIVAKLKGDKEALAGWKETVTEHLIDKVAGTNTALAGGGETGPILLAKLQKFFKKNAPTLSKVFDAKEMNALRRAHKILEPLGNLARQTAGGSNTIENARLFQTMEAGLLGVTGNAITTGMIMKRIRVALAFLPPSATQRLVARQWFDPKLAELLLTREVSKIRAPAWSRRLTGLLAAEQFAQKLDQDIAGEE